MFPRSPNPGRVPLICAQQLFQFGSQRAEIRLWQHDAREQVRCDALEPTTVR